jgi:pyridoxal phosphate enzyme (YggS family)
MGNDLESTIKINWEHIQERIYNAAQRAGRDPNDIDLVAVTKQKTAAVVKGLLNCGIRRMGESYLKEALFKIDLFQDSNVEWHMIGNIQSGKEKKVARAFDCVHSIGSLGTAKALDGYAAKMDKVLPVYLELNVSGEQSKGGWLAINEKSWSDLLPDFSRVLELPQLRVLGVMTMAPYSENPEEARPYFRRMRMIKEYLQKNLPGAAMEGLSMGMSGDFEVAVEEGATILRIGSALVGPRY